MSLPQALDGFTKDTFTHDGVTKDLYRIGSGPAVIVMEEMPGITPAVAAFARRVAELGCTAVVPQLFGTPGKRPSVGYGIQSLVKGCVSKEFAAFATGRTAPVSEWLRALGRHEHERCGGPGIGAVGMCWTGGFALGMMVDDALLAPVLSQPSLPIVLGKGRKRDLHLSPADLARVKQRCQDEPDLCVLGLRFTGDKLVGPDRFPRLKQELGDKFVAVEIDSSKDNPHGIRSVAHSVLTEDLVDEPGHPTHDALTQVLDLFRSRLLTASEAG
jgi:dienelactone hydrolase